MNRRVFTAGFIFNEDKVLLILHKQLKLWLPVGGGVENDETFDESLIREVKEETNLDIEILDEFHDFPIVHEKNIKLRRPFFIRGIKDGEKKTIIIHYICKANNPKKLKIQEEEILDYKWIKEDEIDSCDLTEMINFLSKKAFKEYKEIR